MRRLSKRVFLVGIAAAMMLSVVLSDVSAKGTAPAVDKNETGQSGGTVDGKNMTREEKIAWVEENVSSAEAVYTRVESMLEQAKKEKDAIKISCLQDKLTQLEVNLQGVDERRALFGGALSRGDTADAEQQFRMVQIYVSRVQSLMAEAENCIGESDVVTGDSDTVLTINDDITKENTTDPVEGQVGVEQPVHASGFF